jgi:hypothetical protein
MGENFIIIYGDLSDGIQGAVGPFDTEPEAEYYMDTHNLGHYEKLTITLEKPKGE